MESRQVEEQRPVLTQRSPGAMPAATRSCRGGPLRLIHPTRCTNGVWISSDVCGRLHRDPPRVNPEPTVSSTVTVMKHAVTAGSSHDIKHELCFFKFSKVI